MSLEDVHLLSQILAVALGIPSLVYLALQIANKQMASVYRRGAGDFETLDDDEKTQFFFYTAQYYQIFSTMHALWRRGSLQDEAWHPIRKHLISMMAMRGTRHVWDSWARTGLPPAFVAYVEALQTTGEGTYSLQSALSGREEPEADTVC